MFWFFLVSSTNDLSIMKNAKVCHNHILFATNLLLKLVAVRLGKLL